MHRAALSLILTVAATGCAVSGGEDPLGESTAELQSARAVAISPMLSPRIDHGVAALPDGRILVVGGRNGTVRTTTSEVFDPLTGSWSAGPSFALARDEASVARLRDGRILVAGGHVSFNVSTANAQLLDPVLMRFSDAGTLGEARADAMAPLLTSGRVLIVGGTDNGLRVASAELFDPDGGGFRTLPPPPDTIGAAAAAVLPDGGVFIAARPTASAQFDERDESWSPRPSRVVIVNNTATWVPAVGIVSTGGSLSSTASTSEVQRFDIALGQWVTLAPMSSPREDHGATLLPDGRLLIVGGLLRDTAGVVTALGTFELYDALANSWSAPEPMPRAANSPGVVMLPTGRVLVCGGQPDAGSTSADAWLFDPAVASVKAVAPLDGGRFDAIAARLVDGRVLVAGGRRTETPTGFLSSTELFHPSTEQWTTAGPLSAPREDAQAVLLRSGEVLVVGGKTTGDVPLASVEAFDPAAAQWRPRAPMAEAREDHSVTLLLSGEVMVAGGVRGSNELASIEIYSPGTDSWRDGGRLVVARESHTATLLLDGTVLLAGGTTPDAGAASTSVERYDPATGLSTAQPPLSQGRNRHGAVLLGDGKLLVAGGRGSGGGAALGTAELFDPAAPQWTTLPSMTFTRENKPTFIPLASGYVLIAASGNPQTELYDPAARRFFLGPSLQLGRLSSHVVKLLDGRVLIAGGESLGGNLGTDVVELYDDGRVPNPSFAPVISGPINATPGGVVSIVGQRFTGVSEGSEGTARAAPANQPLLVIERGDTPIIVYARTVDFTATSATVALPSSVPLGWHAARIIVNGIPSTAAPLRVAESNGASCAQDADCLSSACASGTCSAPDTGAPSDGGTATAGDGGDADAGTADGGTAQRLQLTVCGCTSADGSLALLLGLLLSRRAIAGRTSRRR